MSVSEVSVSKTLGIASLLTPADIADTFSRAIMFVCSGCSITASFFLLKVITEVSGGDSTSVVTLVIAWFEGTVTSEFGLIAGDGGVSGGNSALFQQGFPLLSGFLVKPSRLSIDATRI